MDIEKFTSRRRRAIERMGVDFNGALMRFVEMGRKQFAKESSSVVDASFSYPSIAYDAMCAAWICDLPDEDVSKVQRDPLQAVENANDWFDEKTGGDQLKESEYLNNWAAILYKTVAAMAVPDETEINGKDGFSGLGESQDSEAILNTAS